MGCESASHVFATYPLASEALLSRTTLNYQSQPVWNDMVILTSMERFLRTGVICALSHLSSG